MASAGLSTPKKLSPDLQSLLGTSDPIPRTEVISKLWDYIRRNKIQDPANRRNLKGPQDEKWAKVFGKDTFSMFEMNKKLNPHLS